jgi:glycosyltransferase involved in cell wall biosynthesis
MFFHDKDPDGPSLDAERSAAVQGLESLLESGRGPSVDVIVVNYNYGPFLKDCLESIRNQTYDNWRCTIVDNASTDNSREVICSFVSDEDSRFRVKTLDKNLGQMGGFKEGLAETSGDFVCFVDSDDVLLPQSIHTHLAAHFAGRPVAVTSARVVVINEEGRIIAGDSDHAGFLNTSRYLTYRHRQPLNSHEWYWSVTSGMMFRRSVLEFSIPEDTEPFRTCADYFVCHMANLIGGSALIREPLCLYRVHSRNSLANRSVFGLDTQLHDIKRHYDHQTVTRPIMNDHLMANRVALEQILGQSGFLTCYIFVARGAEVRAFIARRKELGYTLPLILRSFVLIRMAMVMREATKNVRRLAGFLRSLWP